jgi:FkbM family methyltransferase
MLSLRLSTKSKVGIAHCIFRGLRFVRGLAGKEPRGVFVRNGMTWDLDLGEGIDLAIYLFGAFEVETTRFLGRLVQPGDIVLDIGANIGAHTLPLARGCAGGGRVYAFEATAYACGKLRRNLELNPGVAHGVEVIHCILSDQMGGKGESQIVSSWSVVGPPTGRDALAGVAKSVGDAQVLTIDHWAEQSGLTRLDLVKIDVDGHEPEIFAGARRTLGRYRPKILMELAPYCHAGAQSKFHEQMFELERLGYRFRRLGRGARPLPFAELAATVQREGSINVFAEAQ